MTTEAGTTVVNPDGSLTTTQSAQATRFRQNGAWRDIDTTLQLNADGTVSPKASPAAVTLSGGGTGAMATVATADGMKLVTGAPFALPAPALSGDTATYTNVLPDVDLKLTATPLGGWRDVLIVHTAQAAADPALNTIHFPLQATGLSTSVDSAGNLSFTDGGGTVRLSAPTAFQWDSTTAAAPAHPAARTASFTADTRGILPAAGTSSSGSTDQAPGPGANVTAMKVATSTDGIDITPDHSALGQGTGPWYLDPGVQTTGWSQQSVQVQEYFPNTKYADKVPNLGTGYCGYSSGTDPCPDTSHGRTRAYFRIAVPQELYTQPSGAPQPPTVLSSTLAENVTGASDPSTATTFGLWWTSGISNDTTWKNQPCGDGMANCNKVTNNSTPLTGTGPISFDVTNAMQQLAGGKHPDWTIAIIPDNENDLNQRHRIANNPSITTTYDLAPSIWWPRSRSGTGQAPGWASNNSHNDCSDGGNPGWFGANQNVSLSVSRWSPTNQQMSTSFKIWDDTGGAQYPSVGFNGSEDNTVTVSQDFLKDGHTYAWYAGVTDGTLNSSYSTACYFKIDMTPPNVSISSNDFPPSGSAAAPTHYQGDSGSFTLTGSDPAPFPGGQSSGVVCFMFSASSTPTSNWNCQSPGAVMADSSGHANASFTPGQWGTNFVYVQAMDNAGNYSQPAAYSFYAPWRIGSPAAFGSITSDQKPSILLPDNAGNLEVIDPAAGDPTHAIAATAASAPGNNGINHFTWNDFQVTHRGTLAGAQPIDQLIAHNITDVNEKKVLYLLNNSGNGTFVGQPMHLTRPQQCALTPGGTPGPCPSDYAPDWSNVTQVVAIGTPEGEATKPIPGQPSNIMTLTSLLGVEDGRLWLFRPSPTTPDDLDTVAQLIPNTGNASWNNYQIIAPGPANGTTTDSNGITHKQATVWARCYDGTIHQYPIIWNNTTNSPDYTALQDPGSGYIPGSGGITQTAYPLVGSSGDLNNDGIPDLWAVNSNKHLTAFSGAANSAGVFTSFAGQVNDLGSVTTTINTTLSGGTILHPGDTAYSAHAKLVMQLDGNLVLYSLNTGAALWSSSTFYQGAWAAMQTDGNLVIYKPKTDSTGKPIYPIPGAVGDSIWSSGTNFNNGAHAVVQDDCNFVIYSANGPAIWSTKTQNTNP
ncbi:hypothetical protein ACFZB9_14330 [Kitasatospora sp. NPDC008050]|uniref:hypothetical protein n=1 Tax=Kitasatospora sp. NPDC008050 TaxID=3364021 RepID=UPI0036ECBE0B